MYNDTGGIDEARISGSLSFATMLSGIEIFTLLGTGDISAYGNEQANDIYGNSGKNYLSGAGGNDKIYFGDKDFASGDAGVDRYIFGIVPIGGQRTGIVTNFEYLETLQWSTPQPLEGATSPILWPIGEGNGETTLLNQLQYSSNGFQTYLSFGLDDVAGADLVITLHNHVKIEDLQVVADGDTITVTNLDVPNKAPTDIALSAPSVKISEDTPVGTVIGTLSAIDLDEKGALAFSLLDGPFSNFSIDGNKLVLAKALDADTPVQYFYASVGVEDSEGAWYYEGFKFEVTDVNDNAPVITSHGGAPTYATSRNENEAVVTEIIAKDPDKTSSLSYSIVGGADKSHFTVDSLGVVSFIGAPDFENPTDSNNDNVYVVDIQVSDGKFIDTQTVALTVVDVASATIQGSASDDIIHGGNSAPGQAFTSNEDDTIFGMGGNDTIYAGAGNDLLDGGTGADVLGGGTGNDVYVIDSAKDSVETEGYAGGIDTVKSSLTWILTEGLENLILTGTASTNGAGNSLGNMLTGNAVANVLDGRGGADVMAGGNGADTYIVDHLGDAVAEVTAGAAGGIDLVKSSVSFTLGANVENLTLTGAGKADATGNSLNNILLGNEGDNRLDGGAGTDSMTGGKGNDTYVVSVAADIIKETIAAGGGIDTVESAITYSLAAKTTIENLTLTGAASKATGNALGNVLTGNSLANILDGGAGKDTMRGGGGNDFYLLDNASDVVEELGSDSGDEVKSAVVRFTAIAGIEHYSYSGAAAWTFVATSADNKVSGGRGADKLDGGNGNDTLIGNAGNDLLVGGVGADWLDGGLGNDTMRGGADKDTYVVNAVGDKIDEEGNADIGDLVQSSITINLSTLGAGLIEDAILLGAAAINATGNGSINQLIGNNGANILDGKGGADILEGGKGADTYVVDNASDQVIESLAGAAGGIDLVKSSISYALGANLEKLTLTEAGNIDGFGNTLNNTLLGNGGDNRLDGGAGNDRMTGGKGSDTYVVNAAGDVVSETIAVGGGIDTVESSITFTLATRVNVENLELTGIGNINGTGNSLANLVEGNSGANSLNGGAGNDTLFGSGGNDTIIGGTGNDLIVGGVGADRLSGNAGRDAFDFNSLAEAGDTITDFAKGAAGDILDLRDLLDSISYAGSDPFTDQILSFNQSGANVIVRVDADGAGVGGTIDLVTVLNVSLTSSDTSNFLV